MLGWYLAEPSLIDTEIRSCMFRNEVENLFFTVQLLKRPNTDELNRLTEYDYYEENTFDTKKELLRSAKNAKIVSA